MDEQFHQDLRNLLRALFNARGLAHVVGMGDVLNEPIQAVKKRIDDLSFPPLYRSPTYRERQPTRPSSERQHG